MKDYIFQIHFKKDISESKKNKMKSEKEKEKKHGIVRGADDYRRKGTK